MTTILTPSVTDSEKLALEAKVFSHSFDAIAICDQSLKVITINQSFTSITGFELTHVQDSELQLWLSYDAVSWEPICQILEQEHVYQCERECPHREGFLFPSKITIYKMYSDLNEAPYYMFFINDLRAQRQCESQMMELMYTDGLTHLPNQLLMRDRLEQALIKAERYQRYVGLVFVDIDHFSSLNESIGHSGGDDVLKEFALRLQARMRSSDTVSRYSADQFIVLSADMVSSRDIQAVLSKIRAIVSKPFETSDGRALMLTVTTGAAVYPVHGTTRQKLLQHAESALGEAKQSGRGQSVIYNPTYHEASMLNKRIETELRQALADKQFVLYYQPQFDMISGNLLSLEALIRWRHPERGLILPGAFIGIAEKSGLILPISDWVLEQACHQQRRWQEMNLDPVPVAINVCATQFRQDLVGVMKRALRRYRLDASLIQLELTESMIMDDVDHVIEALRALKSMGIKLAIDDFGTGYSSLSYLSRFSLDKLKVDRSFVKTILTSEDPLPIPQAIISLAHTLKLKVTAEGVETPEQVAYLRKHLCDEAQGFLLSPPLPSEEISQWLSRKDQLASSLGAKWGSFSAVNDNNNNENEILMGI